MSPIGTTSVTISNVWDDMSQSVVTLSPAITIQLENTISEIGEKNFDFTNFVF